ncbi:hypothetical protein ABC628_00585 [Lentilactobacillus otakiensis]|nr:hypothetical protein [Lentilactobacillus otakiensis]
MASMAGMISHQQKEKCFMNSEEVENARIGAIIETGFKDFETGNTLTEDEMVATFEKYGWHK